MAFMSKSYRIFRGFWGPWQRPRHKQFTSMADQGQWGKDCKESCKLYCEHLGTQISVWIFLCYCRCLYLFMLWAQLLELISAKETSHFHITFPSGFLQIVVDFTASWCGPCKLMAPVFAELSRKFGQLVFVKVDVDEVQVLIPTLQMWIWQ